MKEPFAHLVLHVKGEGEVIVPVRHLVGNPKRKV
jgi:hypothetical protein